jgi:AcrR family transcriptional regulator
MFENKMDRRVQRTEHLLREALIALILEKSYDAITVHDILDRANMGRSTFYAHFQDKEDLLLSGFHEAFNDFQNEYMQMTSSDKDAAQAGMNLSSFFFRHAGEHRQIFKAMIGEKGGKIILDRTLNYLTPFIRDHFLVQLSDRQKNIPVDILSHYVASCFLALLTFWLDNDLPYPADEMDALYQKLVFPGIREMLDAEF